MRSLPTTLLLAALASAGCTGLREYEAHPVPLPEPLLWLQAGVTDSAEVRARLGEPSQVHEEGRIALFDLTPAFERPETRHPGLAPAYSLVLSFDRDQRLQRTSLVSLW